MEKINSRSLPRWTWLAPLVICQLGAYFSHALHVGEFSYVENWSVALGLVMAIWWGPRALPGILLSGVLSAWLWQVPSPQIALLYALPDLIAVAVGWFFFTKVLRGDARLPGFTHLIYFGLTANGPLAFLSGFLDTGMQYLLGYLPLGQVFSQGMLDWLYTSLDVIFLAVPLLVFLTPLLEKAGLALSAGGAAPSIQRFARSSRAERIELAFIFFAILTTSILLPYNLYWVLFGLFGLWAAVRFGFGLAIVTNFFLQVLIVYLPRILPILFVLNQRPDVQANQILILSILAPSFAVLFVGRAVSDLYLEIERRQNAEQALRQSEERLTQVVQNMPVMLDALDEKGQILAWNQECERITGYSADFMIQNPDAWNLLYPEGSVRARIRAAGERLGSDFRDYEYELLTRDGQTKTISWSNVSRFSPIPGWYSWAVGVDVTARRKAEDALQAYADIVQGMQIGIFVYQLEDAQDDRTLRLMMVNPAASSILGEDTAALLGRTMDEIFPQLRAQGVPAAFARVARGGVPLAIAEYPYSQVGLLPKYYAIKVFPLPERSVAVLFEDITERKFVHDLALVQRDLAQKLTTIHNMEEGLQVCLDVVLTIPGMDSGGIYLADPSSGGLRLICHSGLTQAYVDFFTFLRPGHPALALVEKRQPVYASHYADFPNRPDYQVQEGLRSGATLPLHYQGQLLGCLNAGSHKVDDFPAYARLPLESFAAHVANWIARLQAENALGVSARKLETALRVARMTHWEYDISADRLSLNPLFFEMMAIDVPPLGGKQMSADEFLQQMVEAGDHARVKELFSAAIAASDPAFRTRLECKFVRPDGSKFWVSIWVSLEKDREGQTTRLLGVTQDIAAEKQADEIRAARARLIQFAESHSFGELIVAALEELGTLTDSPIGFYHGLHTDQETILLNFWYARGDQPVCSTNSDVRHANVGTAGVWAEAVRERRAVIHNDYPALPQRRDLPAGHADLRRELVVPVFRQERIVAVLGLGNRPSAYGEGEVAVVTRFADLVWDVAERKQAEETLNRRTQDLALLVRAAHELSKSLDLDTMFDALLGFIQETMPCDTLYVSSFNPQDQLIRAAAGWDYMGKVDVSVFPPILLEPEGKGTQSLVLRSGQPLLLNDYEAQRSTATTTYYITEDNEAVQEIDPEEVHSRSALLVPLKLEGQTVGVIQVFSDHLNSYSADHLRLLEALSLHVAIAMANSTLYRQAQTELAERGRVEERLRGSLEEKNALIKEIHHRVKNNMQVMISLISLQAAPITDPKIRAMFLESENRIRSMALVHEQLYRSTSLSKIDFGAYISRLAEDLYSAYNIGSAIRLNVRVEPVTISIELAVPCGLLVNELVTNAFKHAFPGGRGGVVEVTLAQEGSDVILGVADDGVGIPAEMNQEQQDTLGMKLVYLLAAQVEGALVVERTPGMRYRLRFSQTGRSEQSD